MVTYIEDFDRGPGGWMRVIDNHSPVGALPVRDGVVRCQGPWWVDYNHAPPGGGYLQLLMCLVTRGAAGEQSARPRVRTGSSKATIRRTSPTPG